jgi:hypothetical protein
MKSLVGIVKDTNARLLVVQTPEGEKEIPLAGNSPMDDLLEQKRFIGYNATYTTDGSQYRLEFTKEFTNHVIYGSLK